MGAKADKHDALSDCLSCSSGTYSAGGASACTSCAVGFFAGAAKTPACTVCAAGQYAPSAGANTCTACLAGKFLADNSVSSANHDSANDCLACAAGKTSVAGAGACV